MIEAPYPSDLAAKGWALDLDYERIERSDTWAVASPEQRPWLLMVWLVSWRQVPVASLPNDDRLIAARIGMGVEQFKGWRDVMLSGWEVATDGRLYHATLTKHVLRMAEKRVKDRLRVTTFRASKAQPEASNGGVTRYTDVGNEDVRVSSTPTPTPTLITTENIGAGELCKAMKSAGLPAVNPSDPDLAELVAHGVTAKQIADLTREIIDSKGSPPAMRYIVKAMQSRIAAAARAPPKRLPKPENFAAIDYGTSGPL